MNYLEHTLAELACDIPGATRVFHHYKLDFCCGGKVKLGEAIVGRAFSGEQICADLAAVALWIYNTRLSVKSRFTKD